MSLTKDGVSAYVILINDDNTMTVTNKRRIVQRSKLMDDIWFLVPAKYGEYDMSKFTVLLEYLMPVSHRYRNEILKLADDTYNGYLKYLLPIDTKFTAEAGDIEIQLTFLLSDLDENSKSVQRVRKISKATINVSPNTAWSDVIPDCALSALDQRIIKMDAQIKALNEASITISESKADDIDYNTETNELQLLSGDSPIGKKVVLNAVAVGPGTGDSDDGDDVVDFDKNPGEGSDDEEDGNDIVEF